MRPCASSRRAAGWWCRACWPTEALSRPMKSCRSRSASYEKSMPQPERRMSGVRRALSDLGPAGLLPLAVLVALAGVQNFDLVAFGVLAPDIRDTFHVSSGTITAIAGITGAVPIVFAVLLGYAGDRGNRVVLSGVTAVFWGLTALLSGLAPLLALLVVARLLGGVGFLSTETI